MALPAAPTAKKLFVVLLNIRTRAKLVEVVDQCICIRTMGNGTRKQTFNLLRGLVRGSPRKV